MTIASVILSSDASLLQAERIELKEPYPSDRVMLTHAEITTAGTVLTSLGGGKEDELALEAKAVFEFLSRRLAPAGRDALALRAVREFRSAQLETKVAGHETKLALPRQIHTVVSCGEREGVKHYSPHQLLTRDQLDLLDLPSDPLTMIGLLPLEAVEKGDEWKPAAWVGQMLTGIEAVETQELTCTLGDQNAVSAKIDFTGSVKGQRLGANTTVSVRGAMIYDLRTKHISKTQIEYTIDAGVGTVNPGLKARITAQVSRKPTTDVGRLNDALVETIPLNIPEENLNLTYTAQEWGVKLNHTRNWHLFQQVLTGPSRVAIFRFVNLGSLVCQCNIAPIATAANGEHIPLEQFESDIKDSLGKRFKEFSDRSKIPSETGNKVFRVEARGEVVIGTEKAATTIQMVWIYYLVAAPNGQQASFVFAVEKELLDQLGTLDQDMVKSLEFSPVAR